jgi:hypothetical protein
MGLRVCGIKYVVPFVNKGLFVGGHAGLQVNTIIPKVFDVFHYLNTACLSSVHSVSGELFVVELLQARVLLSAPLLPA